MTRLLVSVRNREEAIDALAGGADLIDIKEPTRGALGATDARVWREVLEVVAGKVPVSAALGELLEWTDFDFARQIEGLAMVKAGLANCAHESHWPRRLLELRDALPPGTTLVAVAYADHLLARSPPPCEVMEVARQLELETLLVDTFDKRSGDLLSHLALGEIEALLTRAQGVGLRVALAGALRIPTIVSVVRLQPDWIAVRGAACEDVDRQGSISRERVAAIAAMLSSEVGIGQKEFPAFS